MVGRSKLITHATSTKSTPRLTPYSVSALPFHPFLEFFLGRFNCRESPGGGEEGLRLDPEGDGFFVTAPCIPLGASEFTAGSPWGYTGSSNCLSAPSVGVHTNHQCTGRGSERNQPTDFIKLGLVFFNVTMTPTFIACYDIFVNALVKLLNYMETEAVLD